MYYQLNKLNSRTVNTKPTLADQSGARDTDINVIVGRFGIGNLAPGSARPPIYGDFTQLPNNLKDFINMASGLKELQDRLPDKLKALPLEQLIDLSRDQLNAIFTPPAPPPANGGTT